MKGNVNTNPGSAEASDTKLRALLQSARVAPPLPPRFQENVWRRIEDAEAPAKSATWLDAVAAVILRPRFAYATMAALILAGVLLGAREGNQIARQDAQARYLAMVAPNALR